jgi:S1-C subfamily serine protease
MKTSTFRQYEWGRSVISGLLLILSLASALAPARVLARDDDIDGQAIHETRGPAVCLVTCYSAVGQQVGTGTGFLVNAEEGVIATNQHVITAAARAEVEFPDGRKHKVTGQLAAHAADDLALLKINAQPGDLPEPIPVGNSFDVRVGQEVAVIGHPLGMGTRLSTGIISGIDMEDGEKRFNMTAAISQGSSGSPVFDTDMEVIGIAVATIMGGQNLNLAIPSNRLKDLINKTSLDAQPRALSAPAVDAGNNRWVNLGISLVVMLILGTGVWRLNKM